MNTKIRKNKNIFFIDIKGYLNLNGVEGLKSFCDGYFKKHNLVCNLSSLDFVGSVGIEAFSETLTQINKTNNLKICCASSEFRKVLGQDSMFIYETEQEAVSSFE